MARPFIKWQGGKARVLPKLRPVLPKAWSRYHAPFLGGGALALDVADSHGLQGAELADANQELIRAYRVVQSAPKALLARLAVLAQAHCDEHFYSVRAQNPRGLSDVDCAARFVYLNRAGFNGLYRVNRKGQFNAPVGRIGRKPNQRPIPAETIARPDEILGAHEALQGASLSYRGVWDSLELVEPGDLLYLDPPYVPERGKASTFTAYTSAGFGIDDQERLAWEAVRLAEAGAHVVVSNHDTPRVRALYGSFRFVELTVRRNGGVKKGGKAAEIIMVGPSVAEQLELWCAA